MKKLSKALNNAVSAENLEDIIFEGRNQEYGAYALRRNYNESMRFSLLLVVSFASLITILVYQHTVNQPPVAVSTVQPPRIVEIKPGDISKLLPPPSFDVNIPKSINRASSFGPPVIVEEVSKPVELLPIEEWQSNQSADDPNLDLSNISLIYTDNTDNIIEAGEKTFNDFEVNEQAMFMGGTVEDFRNWLLSHMQYPLEASQIGLEGTVFVKFTVGKDGKIRDVIVQRKVHPILDQAAVDAILKSPDKWKAARRNGYDVNVSYTIPIKYSLQN